MKTAFLALFVAALAFRAGAAEVTNNGVVGFKDTPMQPGGKWHVHDPERPQPPLVQPGTVSTQDLAGKPPSDAIVLFDGTDLSQWRDKSNNPAPWRIESGAAIPVRGDIVSVQEFGDVQLHVEFCEPVPARGSGQGRGNSGVFLMGRYEIQVLDGFENKTYADGSAGALYGQHPPLVNACLPAGHWQVYDILFTAPRWENGKIKTPASATVLHNGVVVQFHQSFRGPTNWKNPGSYTTPHGPTGPIVLQFHGNPVRFRNIWARPLQLPDEP